LRSHLTAVSILDGQSLLVYSEGGHTILEGPIYPALAEHLGAGCSTPDLARKLASSFTYPEVIQALLQLQARGLLTHRPVDDDAQDNFWEGRGVSTPRGGRVSLLELGGDSGPVALALESTGVEIAEDEDDVCLTLVVTNDYLSPEVVQWAQQHTGPWLPLKPVGYEAWIGPVFGVEGRPCFHCLVHRLKLRNPYLSLQLPEPVVKKKPASLPAGVLAASALAATIASRWTTEQERESLGLDLLEMEFPSFTTKRHTVVKRPQCPACGEPSTSQEPPVLADRPFFGARSSTPESFLQRFSHHVSPITGVVSDLRSLAETPVHLYSAPYRGGWPPTKVESLSLHSLQQAGGKGTTDLQARASALGEALERYCSSWSGQPADLVGSLEELGDRCLHPNEVMLFSEQQYKERTLESRPHKQFVPEIFDPECRLEWKRLWSLTHERWRFLPQSSFYYDYFQEPRMSVGSSNGVAAGASLEDAILHGFLELIERDSVAIWWYNKLRCPRFDLEGLDSRYIASLRHHYEDLEREFWVLDVTTDLKIPSFVAVSVDKDPPHRFPVFGFGSHLDPRKAALRALTEMNQLQPGFLQQAQRSDRQLPKQQERQNALWWDADSLDYILPCRELPATTQQDYPLPSCRSSVQVIEHCREVVESRGYEMLVADMTQPDIGMPVAKVVVPGLRHFWRRFAPGRLYTVPVTQGRLSQPRKESELNSVELNN